MLEGEFPNITAVDEHDEVVGYYQLFDALAQGLTRRVSCIFVFNEQGHILIQRRSAHVLSPNLLDYSAAGHVNEGDEYLSTAQSELSEELGITDLPLTLIAPPFLTPGYFNAVFVVKISNDIVIKINPDEVSKVLWVSYTELEEMITRHPHQFTESFLAVWPHVRDKINV